jgi:hypothetical protein
MIALTTVCSHPSVASHGTETRDRTMPGSALRVVRETGWCRDCSQYVQREIGGVAWTLRLVPERGAWMWRPSDQRESARLFADASRRHSDFREDFIDE